jgi:biopolymer transport protein ExbB
MVEQLKSSIVMFGAEWVLWTLIAVSVISVGVMIDRLHAFWGRRDPVFTLATDLAELLKRRDLEGARARLMRGRGADVRIALAGLFFFRFGAPSIEAALAAASGLERSRLERRLLILGTIGNNAPFIGLLGTVIGVVGAFDELGRAGAQAAASGALAPDRLMGTIAEALVATAAGLVVAIPAVCAFNYFQGLLAARLADAETLGQVLLTHAAASKSDEG